MADEKIPPKDDESEEIKSRREALGKILIGGGVVASASFLPEKWVKPVVDFIEVPAHALTSPIDPTSAPTIGPTAAPTISPTAAPTISPTAAPTISPTPQ